MNRSDKLTGLLGLYPLCMMLLFFVGPLLFMVAVSFYLRDPLGFFKVDFVFDNYQKFFSAFYTKISLRSIWSAALSAVIVVAITLPLTYVISDLSRRWQLFWIIFLLAMMCLSEVIIGFAWIILLSESAGIPKFLGWIGALENPRSLSPGFSAMMIGMVSLGISIVALMFFPQMAGRDRSIEEAALTLGTPPLRVFPKVVVPAFTSAITSSIVTMFIYYLGVYVMPTMLGRPQDWNMSVIITDKAIGQSNMPLGAALSVVMMVFSVFIILTFYLLSRKSKT